MLDLKACQHEVDKKMRRKTEGVDAEGPLNTLGLRSKLYKARSVPYRQKAQCSSSYYPERSELNTASVEQGRDTLRAVKDEIQLFRLLQHTVVGLN